MKIVFSYIHSSIDKPMDLNMARLSLYFIKKLNYPTCIYLDQKNFNKFDNLKYDEKILLDQSILDKLPSNVWSLGKLLVFSQIKEPFIHIDFDLFCMQDNFKYFLNEKFLAFHEEPWTDFDIYETDIKHAFSQIELLKNQNINDIKVYNCAAVGGNAIPEINKSAQLVLEYAIKNKDYFLKRDEFYNSIWSVSVFFEQLLFMNLVKKLLSSDVTCILDEKTSTEKHQPLLNLCDKIGVDFIVEEMARKNIIHLWGSKEKFLKNFYLLLQSRKIN
jgi:hypothetical protein